MKRSARSVVALLGALLALVALVSPASAAVCADCLRAGAASVALRVPAGTPLAGYGGGPRRLIPDVFGRYPHAFWFRPHEGQRDPLHARALVLEAGATRLVWVTLDVVAVDAGFTGFIQQRLRESGIPPASLLLSASHTHSGPGAFLESEIMAVVAVDRFHPTVRNALAGAIVEAVRGAWSRMAAARVATTTVPGPAVVKARLRGPLDRDVVVVKIVAADGQPIAAVWNYAIHPTMLGPSNLRLSGDVTGLASNEIERAIGAPALFVNGAQGDVSPARHGWDAARETAHELAKSVIAAWSGGAKPASGRLDVASERVALGAPSLSLRDCIGRWVPGRLTVPLGSALPREAEVVAARVGEAAWVSMPGEPAATLGLAVKRAARARWRHPFVAALTNDYLGYFMTRAQYAEPAYVTCATLFGPDAGERLARAARELLERLDAPAVAGR